MKKTILAVATGAVLAAATLAPTTADARWRGGPGIGFGILGGVIAGAIIGSAIAGHPGYYAYDEYRGPPPRACPGGYWARRAWQDEYGNVHYSRPVYFCG